MERCIIKGIYAIRNKLNEKVYIGQSIDVKNRLCHHRSELRNSRHYNTHLQRAWDAYGEKNFEFMTIKECCIEDIDKFEEYYIYLYQSTDRDKGYNRENGGVRFRGVSEDTRRKMSEAKKGMYDGEKNPMYGRRVEHTEERKQKMSKMFSGKGNPMYGRRVERTQETLKKMSEMFSGEGNPFYGKKHTQETKDKMRKNNKKKKAVKCVESGIVYESCSEASRQTGVYVDSIIKCCGGRQHTAGKCHWKYVT